MSRTEKRHFKLNNRIYKGENKDFLRLFDYLNSMEEYDKEKIENFFIQNIKNKNLCIGYLLDKLVESIDDEIVHLADNEQNILTPHMKILRTYIKTELIDLALKELKKIEQLAQRYALYAQLHLIYKIWGSLIASTYFDDRRQFKEKKELHLKRCQLNKNTEINNNINHANISFAYCSPESQEFKEASQLLFQYNHNQLSPMDKILYFCAYYWYSAKIGENKQAYENCKNALDIFHQNPDFIAISFEEYISGWNNFLMSAIDAECNKKILDYQKKYWQVAQKFKKIFEAKPDAIKAFYELVGLKCEVAYSINSEDYKRIKVIGKNTLKTLDKYPTSISRANSVTGLFIRLAYGAILLGDLNEANLWMHKLSALYYIDKVTTAPDTAILELLILYEEQSYVLFESKLRSYRRQWKNMANQPKEVIFMANLLNQLLLKRNQNKLPEIYKTAYQEICIMEKEPQNYLPYSRWIAQKISAKATAKMSKNLRYNVLNS